MKLITAEIAKKTPRLYEQSEKGDDAIAYAKFFTPDSSWTWYMTEYDPEQRLAFGYVCGFENELGYFSIDELEGVRGKMGLPIERDRFFTPMTLREVKKLQ